MSVVIESLGVLHFPDRMFPTTLPHGEFILHILLSLCLTTQWEFNNAGKTTSVLLSAK
jgi:hypothetical protein